jgi:GNAT superfamily N-acetyltransferase
MDDVKVRRAGASDRQTAVRLLDETFQHDPVSNWVFPDEAHRRAAHGPFLEAAFLDAALTDQGFVDITENGSAVALWLNVPADAPTAAPQGEGDDRGAIVARLTAEAHPHGVAHRYLMLVAVTPERQGQGLGTALIASALDACDRDGVPAYLEASSPRSRELYLRLGFADTGHTVQLPDGGPRMWPMWRDPHVDVVALASGLGSE